MKKLTQHLPGLAALLLLTALTTAEAWAGTIRELFVATNWIQIGQTDKASYYIDTASIRRPSKYSRDVFKFDYLINLSTTTPQGARSIVVKVNYDCTKNALYTEGVSVYRSEMGKDLIDSADGSINIKMNNTAVSLVCNR